MKFSTWRNSRIARRTTVTFVVAAAAIPASGHAATSAPRLQEVAVPPSVSAGASATIRLRQSDAGACRLQLLLGRASREMSTVEPNGAKAVTWRWRVPPDAAPKTWTASVGCWASSGDAGRQVADVESRTETLRVRGTGGRQPQLVVPGTLAARLDSKAADNRSDLEKATSWFAIVTAILGVPGLFFIARTLVATRQEARSERTAHLLERMNNRDILGSWSNVLQVVNVGSEADCVDRVRRAIAVPTGNDPLLSPEYALFLPTGASRTDGQSPSTSLNDIQAFTNFYEEVALLYNKRRIDRELLDRGFGGQIIRGFCLHWWWIQYSRRGKPAAVSPGRARVQEIEVYADWERMVRRILRKRPDYRLQDQEFFSVRSLCLPTSEGVTDDDWRDCKKLTTFIGERLRDVGPTALADEIRNGQVSHIGTAEPGLTICIPHYSEIQSQPRLWRRAVRRLGSWLNREGKARGLGARLERADPQVSRFQPYHEASRLLHEWRQPDAAG